VHKELDCQLVALQKYVSQPGVDRRRLDALVSNLVANRDQLASIGTGFLQTIKDSEFLSAIKHRSAIPGGPANLIFRNTATGCGSPTSAAGSTWIAGSTTSGHCAMPSSRFFG